MQASMIKHGEAQFEMPSKEGIELLFPNWKYEQESVSFLCGHDDDALAGSAMLINRLTKDLGAKVNIFVLTDAKHGYEPSQIITAYPDIARKTGLHDLLGLSQQSIKDLLAADDGLFKKVTQALFKINAIVRTDESYEAYGLVGVPAENISYFENGMGKTIGDFSIRPHMTLEMPDGSDGIYSWLIKGLRETKTTRILAPNPGDTHEDHQLAAEIGYKMGVRARSNMLHLGRPAQIVPYSRVKDEQGVFTTDIPGLYYVIYERLLDDTALPNKSPTMSFVGNDVDVSKKESALSVYKSQPGLLPLWKNTMPDPNHEHFYPMPDAARLIRSKDNYSRRHLKNAEEEH